VCIARIAFPGPQFNVRIKGFVIRRAAGPDFQNEGIRVGTILQVMPVRFTGPESGAVSRPQCFLAGIGHQHYLAFENQDEFILDRVPVALTRPGPRRQPRVIDTELPEAGCVAEPAPDAPPAWLVKGAWISGTNDCGQGFNVDSCGHRFAPDCWLEGNFAS
jgi:hypothetical protein